MQIILQNSAGDFFLLGILAIVAATIIRVGREIYRLGYEHGRVDQRYTLSDEVWEPGETWVE